MNRSLLFLCLTIFQANFVGAAESPAYCLQAQHWIAETEMNPEVVEFQDFDAFVKSKASIEPFQIHKYFSGEQPDGETPAVLSCKLKSAEALNNAFAAEEGAAPVAGENTSCQHVTRMMLDQTVARLRQQGLSVAADTFTIDEEESTYMGPQWLADWPFQPVVHDEDGVVHLRTRALQVLDAWYIPLPDSIKGVYYCHLIAPQYLEKLLRQQAAVN